MSQLIRSRKTVTTAPCSIIPPPTLIATAPAEMDPRLVNLIDLVGPWVSQVSASSTSSVALPISARRGHHLPRTPDTTLASTTDASRSQQEKYPGTLSLVEDGEGHPGDEHTYHDRIGP